MKKILTSFLILFAVFTIGYTEAKNQNGLSTEELHRLQVQKDDEILAKDPSTLTVEEQIRLQQIKKAQTQKRSLYEQRGMRKLANEQPKTYDEYEKMSEEIKSKDLNDFNPQFKKDPYYEKVPEPKIEVVRYNYPAGSKEINLNSLITNRHAHSTGVISPDNTKVAYTDVNYEVNMRKASSDIYIIPVNPLESKTQKRLKYLQSKEAQLNTMKTELEQNKNLTRVEKQILKDKIKELSKEIEKLRIANQAQNEEDNRASQNDTPAQRTGKLLLQAHIKDRIKEPILSSGIYNNDYGVQRILTIVDWSQNSKLLAVKEKISKEGDGTWQTNLWVYDFETGKSKKLDEVRQAIEYYWNKNRSVDLYYHRFDIYPLGWDAQHPDRILLYAYGYNKNSGNSPKFLGTWSIDYKGEQSHLVSVLKTNYIVQANGFCLKTKNVDYYER